MQEIQTGLSTAEAKRRLVTTGPNLLDKPPGLSLVKLGVKQFVSPLMLILLGALGVTIALGDTVDAWVIFMSLFFNAILGFWQEYKAEKSLEALSEVLAKKAIVIRDGVTTTIAQEEIVPGDLIVVGAGERVAADGHLIKAEELNVTEAVLTGESLAVRKFVGNKIYAGTAVAGGEGLMIADKTGMETEVGKIAQTLSKTSQTPTPLQKRLEAMGKGLSLTVLVIIAGLVGIGIIRGLPPYEMVMVAVAVGVAAIPEGLAISLTAILTVGMRRILKRKALVRKLLAAEVLGSVSVICTDKTGTLTYGVMKVKQVVTQDKELMSEAAFLATGRSDQMEAVLHDWAGEALTAEHQQRMDQEKVIARQPFSSERKYSVTLTQKEIFMMGAPEVLIGMSTMPEAKRQRELDKVADYARQGYRLIAVLHRKRQGETAITPLLKAKRWYYLGLVVYEDKVREKLRSVFRDVGRAGIKVKVITGDYPETARAVMRQIGVKLSEQEMILGDELMSLSPEELEMKVGEAILFARINPTQKLMIVKALQRTGEVVAMTGDGVNDAPALKQADVGIVVSTATEVARETADMVLLDNNFATIVAAVEEGRGMYKNLRKVILYLMADSMTQVLLVVGSIMAGLPLVLTTVQVLWINLVTDSLPALALTVDPHVLGLMDKPPRKPNEAIINKQMGILMGLISGLTALIIFGVFYYQQMLAAVSLIQARTFAFTLTATACILVVFSSRSMMTPLWKDSVGRNGWLLGAVFMGLGLQVMAVYLPWLQTLMGTTALPARDWAVILGLCGGVIIMVEGVKFWLARMSFDHSGKRF